MKGILYDEKERPVSEVKQSQRVRLYVDVLVISPFLVYLAVKGKVSKVDALILLGIGVSTILYNSRNLAKNIK